MYIKKSVKNQFGVRVVIALVIIFMCMSVLITICDDNSKDDEIQRDIDSLTASICQECMEYNFQESKSLEDQQKVYAIINAYMYANKSVSSEELKDLKISMYSYADAYNEDVFVQEDITPCIPATSMVLGVIYEEPSNNYEYFGVAIILDEVCNKEQLKQIDNLFEDYYEKVEISNMEGYIEGHLFYPSKLTISNGKDEIEITSDTNISSKKTKPFKFFDVQLCMSNGNTYYNVIEYELLSEKDCADLAEGLGGYISQIKDNLYYKSVELPSDDVCVISAELNTIVDSIKSLWVMYIAMGVLLILVGVLLVVEYDNTVGLHLKNEQRRRNMMDALAHEMKTPLAVIRNYSEVLLEETQTEKHTRFIKKIIDETEDLNDSIIGVLDLSKMEAGTYPLELSSVSVGELLKEELNRKTILFDRKKITVNVNVNETERIVIDEKLVKNILSNYLSNAGIHTPEHGQIYINVIIKNEEAYIEIENEGSYIPKDDQDKIWEVFYGNKTLNKNSNGLGLAIVKNACLLHDGDYGCKNTSKGVLFWARVKSMEENIETIENNTGYVKVSKSNNPLKCFAVMAVGVCFCILASVVSLVILYGNNTMNIESLLPELLFNYGGYFYNIQKVLLYIGTAFVLVGLIRAYINHLIKGKSVIAIMAIGVGIAFFSMPFIDGPLVRINYILHAIVMLILTIRLASNCILILGHSEKPILKNDAAVSRYKCIFIAVTLVIYEIVLYVIQLRPDYSIYSSMYWILIELILFLIWSLNTVNLLVKTYKECKDPYILDSLTDNKNTTKISLKEALFSEHNKQAGAKTIATGFVLIGICHCLVLIEAAMISVIGILIGALMVLFGTYQLYKFNLIRKNVFKFIIGIFAVSVLYLSSAIIMNHISMSSVIVVDMKYDIVYNLYHIVEAIIPSLLVIGAITLAISYGSSLNGEKKLKQHIIYKRSIFIFSFAAVLSCLMMGLSGIAIWFSSLSRQYFSFSYPMAMLSYFYYFIVLNKLKHEYEKDID